MSTTFHEDVSGNVLLRMKEGGFDFARVHPIEFYAVFPDRERACAAASNFRGECVNTQIAPRERWHSPASAALRDGTAAPAARGRRALRACGQVAR